jgi:hypothetical protein
MAVVPAETAVANPLALIVATPVLDDVQVTWLVIFCVVLSEKVPVAENGWETPTRIAGFAGVTAIEVSDGGALTVNVVLLVTLASAAAIVVLPAETAVAKPLALMVANVVFDDVHATWVVRFCALPSE